MDWLHQFFIPSEKNGYRPNSLELASVGILAVLILGTFSLANVQALLLVSSDWLSSAVLPATLVELTNTERGGGSVPGLARSALLDRAATLKAEDMAREGYFSHDSPAGITPWHWFSEVGYRYAYAGENLAVHFSDSHDVVEAWMKSPGHRANILNTTYTEIGIGTAKGVYKGVPTVFVVQLFGTPRATPERTESVAQFTPSTVSRATSTRVLGARDSVEKSQSSGTRVDASTPLRLLFTERITHGNEDLIAQAVPSTRVKNGTASGLSSTSVDAALGVRPHTPAPTQTSVPVRLGNVLFDLLSSPKTILGVIYACLVVLVLFMLLCAVVMEWRRQHPVQVAYGVALLALMCGAYTLHISLATGALVI
jgi:hypothetical protein